jgi:phosphopentomutase
VGYRRVFLIVLDGLGVGRAPDADAYGDTGSDTLGHLLGAEPVDLPQLASLGLGLLYDPPPAGLAAPKTPQALHCRLTELSAGKDSTTGHWELMGLRRERPAPVFPHGFPAEFMAEFSRRVGRACIGNRPASGTVIIQELGARQRRDGTLIVYTSADSVFQVAAHLDAVPLEELYDICRTAREMLTGELAVDRVIARPFAGDIAGGFTRTPDRRDFALPPPGPTVLDGLKAAGLSVIGIGKIGDIFTGQGLTTSLPVHGNRELMRAVSQLAAPEAGSPVMADWRGLAFCNLVDFDMLYGHRNNSAGFAAALGDFDSWLGGFLKRLAQDELLLITADHGNDPTTPSTDHSREQVPLLITSRAIATAGGRRLWPAPGLWHVGATVAAALGVDSGLPGMDMLAGNGEES